MRTFKEFRQDAIDEECESCHFDLVTEQAEYQGKKVTLNDPFRTPKGPKKFPYM